MQNDFINTFCEIRIVGEGFRGSQGGERRMKAQFWSDSEETSRHEKQTREKLQEALREQVASPPPPFVPRKLTKLYREPRVST